MSIELTGETRIRALISRHPSCLRVLMKHGFAGCGGPSGPDESLGFFAQAHQLPLQELLAELASEVKDPGPATAHAPQPPPVIMPYVVSALLATLTAGSLLGAINLFRIQFRLEGVAAELVRLHASFQLNGLMGLFICGVALHALPRFWGSALAPRPLAFALPALVVASLAVRTAAVLSGAAAPWTAASDAILVMAGLVFASWVIWIRRASTRSCSGLDALLVFGALAWPAGNALWFAGEYPDLREPWLDLGVKAGEEVLLFGFLMAWLLGMGPRVLPFFTELGHPRARAGWVLAALLSSGVAIRQIGFVGLESLSVGQVGQLVTAAALLFFASRMDRPGAKHLPIAGTTGAFRTAVLAALAWCTVGALMFAVSAARGLFGAAPLSYFAIDAARHLVAVGFAFGLLIAVSSRLVPTFTGRAFPHPRAVDRGLMVLHAGVALRLLQSLAPSGAVQVLYVSGLSGFLVVLGFLPWAYNLICLATPEPAPSGPITGRTRISDILARSPRHLTVLVEQGFGALANPVLRRSLARLVTLEDACRLHRIDLDRVLAALRALDEPPPAGGVLSPP